MRPEVSRRWVVGALGAASVGLGATQLHTDAIETTRPEPGTWPSEQYDAANTSANPHAAVGANPTIDWDAPVAAETLVVGPDRVYAGGERLVALSRTDGSVVWQQNPPGRQENLHVRRGVLYHSQDETRAENRPKRLRALDARTGREHWGSPRGWVLDTLLTRESLVLSRHDDLVAVEPSTGAKRWRSGTDVGSLVASGGHLYSLGDDLRKFADRDVLDTATDSGPGRAWKTARAPGNAPAPVVADERVVTAGELVSRTNQPDSPRTAFPSGATPTPPSTSPPVPALATHETRSGSRAWGALWSDEVPVPAGERYGVRNLAVADGLVLAGITYDQESPYRGTIPEEALAAFSLEEGTREWQVGFYRDRAESAVTAVCVTAASVVVATDRPYATDDDGGNEHPPAVRALDLRDGTERWRVELPDPAYSVAVVGDTVFAAVVNGPVVAVR